MKFPKMFTGPEALQAMVEYLDLPTMLRVYQLAVSSQDGTHTFRPAPKHAARVRDVQITFRGELALVLVTPVGFQPDDQ